jgi:hypothetical protein
VNYGFDSLERLKSTAPDTGQNNPIKPLKYGLIVKVNYEVNGMNLLNIITFFILYTPAPGSCPLNPV